MLLFAVAMKCWVGIEVGRMIARRQIAGPIVFATVAGCREESFPSLPDRRQSRRQSNRYFRDDLHRPGFPMALCSVLQPFESPAKS